MPCTDLSPHSIWHTWPTPAAIHQFRLQSSLKTSATRKDIHDLFQNISWGRTNSKFSCSGGLVERSWIAHRPNDTIGQPNSCFICWIQVHDIIHQPVSLPLWHVNTPTPRIHPGMDNGSSLVSFFEQVQAPSLCYIEDCIVPPTFRAWCLSNVSPLKNDAQFQSRFNEPKCYWKFRMWCRLRDIEGVLLYRPGWHRRIIDRVSEVASKEEIVYESLPLLSDQV